MKRRLNRTTKQYITVAFLCVFIIGGAFTLVYFTVLQDVKKNYQKELHVLSEQLKTNTVYVYEANKSIEAGTIITKEDINYIKSYTKQGQEYYMSEDEIGSIALIDIKEGTHILKGMLTDSSIDSNLREVECNTFLINSNIKENDSIDVRIMFPNGEDFVVLSKKNVKNLSIDINNCFLWLTEEEILNISAAIVDSYIYSGTKLYTTKYIEPNLQDASKTTYHPSVSTLTLMEQDDNIVDKASQEVKKRLRKDLERRLEVDLNSVTDNINTSRNAWIEDSITKEYDIPNKSTSDNVSSEIGEIESTNIDQADENDYFIQDDVQGTEDIIEYGG